MKLCGSHMKNILKSQPFVSVILAFCLLTWHSWNHVGKLHFLMSSYPHRVGKNEKAEWQFLYTSQIYPLWNFVLTLLWNCPSAMKEIFGKAAHQVSFLRDDVLACICINIISGSGDEAHMSAHWLCYHSLHEPILGRWLPLVYSSLLTNYRCFTSSLAFPV